MANNPKMANRLRFALITTASALVATTSLAADPPAVACHQVPDYAEMIACHIQEAQTTNTKVVQAYELLMKRLGTSPAADRLSQSQKAWLDYQSSYCAFVALANEGGSIVRLTRATCSATIAKSRLRELEYQVNCEEGYFGCFRQP